MSGLSFADELEALYFVFQHGCDACAEAEPELTAFAAKHPAMVVLRLNAGAPLVERLGVKIRATPTYVYRRGQGVVVREGGLTAAEIEKFVSKAPVEEAPEEDADEPAEEEAAE